MFQSAQTSVVNPGLTTAGSIVPGAVGNMNPVKVGSIVSLPPGSVVPVSVGGRIVSVKTVPAPPTNLPYNNN